MPTVRKLHSVFISSTQRDLLEERRGIADRLVDDSFVPIQMERFPAATQQAMSAIQEYIDSADYYVLVLGHQYGSVLDGTSYTEREYDYAVDRGKPVLAFIRQVPEGVVLDDRLVAFRDRVQNERVCKYWGRAAELETQVISGLQHAVVHHPTAGWIRGDSVPADLAASMTALVEPARLLGIARISRDGIARETMSDAISAATSVRILSTSGLRLVETQKRALVRAVETGCSIQVLVPEPQGLVIQDIDEIEGRQRGGRDSVAAEIDVTWRRLEEIFTEASSSGSGQRLGEISLGYMTSHLRSTMILTDSWGWLTLTLPPLRTPETASLELRDGPGSSLLQSATRHFDRVWSIVETRGRTRVVGASHP